MALWYEETSNVVSGDAVTMGSGDELYVAPNVQISSTGGGSGVNSAGMIEDAEIYGSIYGSYGIYTTDGNNNIHVGTGGSVSGASYGMYLNGNHNFVSNNGDIAGNFGLLFYDSSNVIINSGTITGSYDRAINLTGGDNQVVNSGTISAPDDSAIAFNTGGSESNANTIDNSGTISSGGGYEAIFTNDLATTITNSGMIAGGVHFGNGNDTLSNKGAISGNVRFGSGTNLYDGTLGSVTGTLFAGSGTNTLYGGAGKETFDLSQGTDTADGGAGNDTFLVGANLAHVSIDGGSGTDTVVLSGATKLKFTPTTMVDVEKLQLATGHNYNLTTNDATVAAGQTLTIDGSALSASNVLTFNGAAETDGHFKIIGGLGADNLTGGALSDTFTYTTAAQSTSTHYDTITGFNFAKDIFNIPGGVNPVTGINTKVTTGTLSTASFDANLTSALSGHLTAHHAILFTPNAGTLSGDTFLVVDLNGTAGYQTGHDLVIRMNGSSGTLAAGGFH